MIEVHPGLFVGSQDDLPEAVEREFFIIHAAKEPWHRQALGYVERAAPKDHPDYLFAYGMGWLALNMIDAPDPAYIPEKMVNAALLAITVALASEAPQVLIHCNLGHSRAPGLALLWLRRNAPAYANLDYDEAAELFRETYPLYEPGKGIEGYLRAHWDDALDLPQTAA